MRFDVESESINKNSAKNDLYYIKTIICKSEMDYWTFFWYFLVLTIFFFFSNFLVRPFLNDLVRKYIGFVTGDRIIERVALPFAMCVWKIITLPFLLLILSFFYKRVKSKNQGISQWVFKIQAFILLVCNVLFSLTAVVVSASDENAEMFSVISSALVSLIIGILSDKKKIRRFAYVYIILSFLMLIIIGIPNLFYDFLAERIDSVFSVYVHVFIYVKIFIYEVCPVIAYAILSVYMYFEGKRGVINDL